MRRAKTVWWLVAAVLLSGCVPSLHAIYRDQDLVFNPHFLGVWKQVQSPETWEFQKRDDDSYRLTYTDRAGNSGNFVAHLADVKGTMFLDLYPEHRDDDTPGLYRVHQLPIHTIYLVKEVNDKVVLATIDYEWLQKYAAAHPDEVPSVTTGTRLTLTASTGDLQRFLVEHKDRFTRSFSLERQSTPAENEQEPAQLVPTGRKTIDN